MAEDFNDLIDQTETRAQALVIEADKAIQLLDSVDAMVDNLSSTIEESANEAKESFDTLTEQITTAEDTLQTQQGAAKESMNGLMQQMQEAGGKIRESLTSAFNKFDELQAKKQEFLEEEKEEVGKVSEGFGDLAEKSDNTFNNISEWFTPLNESIDLFLKNSSNSLENIDTQNNSLTDRLSAFVEVTGTADDTAYKELEQLFQAINVEVQTTAQNIVRVFEKTVYPEQEIFITSIQSLNSNVKATEQEILTAGQNNQQLSIKLNDSFARATVKAQNTISFSRDMAQELKLTNETLL